MAPDGSYGASTTFESTAAGFECDNPADPLAPESKRTKRASVSVEVREDGGAAHHHGPFECHPSIHPSFLRLELGTVTCADCDQCADSDGALDEYFPVDQKERAVRYCLLNDAA